jgi:chromate transporter
VPEDSTQLSAAATSVAEHAHRPSLASLVAAFGTIGLTSFGGARAAFFRHTLVLSRPWVTEEEFLEGLTVSQVLPGPNVTNLSVYLGQRLRGLLGGLLAMLAFVLPGAVMIVVLAGIYFGHTNLSGMTAVFRGVGAVAVGLSVATVMQVGVRGARGVGEWLAVTATFVAVALLHVSLIVPLLTLAPIAVWWNRPRATNGPAPAAQEGP